MNSNNFFLKCNRGFALLPISVVIVLLTMIGSLMFARLDIQTTSNAQTLREEQAFLLTEGLRPIIIQTLQNYIRTVVTPDAVAMTNLLNDPAGDFRTIPNLVPEGFTLQPVTVELVSHQPAGVIPNGPYAGMTGPLTTLKLFVEVIGESHSEEYRVASRISETVTIAAISMFQFATFIDLPTVDWGPSEDQDVDGQIFANGDICIGEEGTLRISKLTSAGRILDSDDSRCPYPEGEFRSNKVFVANNSTFTTFQPLFANGDNGCTNCQLTGTGWVNYALARWVGNVLDRAHGITKLQFLPDLSTNTQFGTSGEFVPTSNAGNMRFLIDPVLVTDAPDAKALKFAHQADIRIIDGVWFLKNPADPQSWPGVPIWSDHPGRANINGMFVGQRDIREYWQMSNPWPSGLTPIHYSYYEYDESTRTLYENDSGVISYGSVGLFGPAEARSKPGFWLDPGNVGPICNGGGLAAVRPKELLSSILPSVACAVGPSPKIPTLLLNATRSGFRDAHIAMTSQGTTVDREIRSKVLPVNFDVERFQAALLNTAPGELGSYFGASRFMQREFNGIVYVTATWPGSLAGFGTGWPTPHPAQGLQSEAPVDPLNPRQIDVTSLEQQRALPVSLCTDTLIDQPFDWDAAGGVNRFEIPSCASFTEANKMAYMNSVRVMNGSNLNPAVLTRGLTIASNLPVYLQGGYNLNSDTTSMTSTPWVPSLVAGDQITVLSSAWTDEYAPWNINNYATDRNAQSTIYNTALLGGWTRSDNDGGLQRNPGLLEDWNSGNRRTVGSTVVGFHPVYMRNGRMANGRTYHTGDRDVRYDPHYRLISNQPPGTPLFFINATYAWTRF